MIGIWLFHHAPTIISRSKTVQNREIWSGVPQGYQMLIGIWPYPPAHNNITYQRETERYDVVLCGDFNRDTALPCPGSTTISHCGEHRICLLKQERVKPTGQRYYLVLSGVIRYWSVVIWLQLGTSGYSCPAHCPVAIFITPMIMTQAAILVKCWTGFYETTSFLFLENSLLRFIMAHLYLLSWFPSKGAYMPIYSSFAGLLQEQEILKPITSSVLSY